MEYGVKECRPKEEFCNAALTAAESAAIVMGQGSDCGCKVSLS
jgi:hypothetical protein